MSDLPRLLASSGVVTMAQAEPSETPQQSYRPSGAATIGAFITVSMVIFFCRCALGLRAPLSWLLTETWAMACFRSLGLQPCLATYAAATWAKLPGAERLGQNIEVGQARGRRAGGAAARL